MRAIDALTARKARDAVRGEEAREVVDVDRPSRAADPADRDAALVDRRGRPSRRSAARTAAAAAPWPAVAAVVAEHVGIDSPRAPWSSRPSRRAASAAPWRSPESSAAAFSRATSGAPSRSAQSPKRSSDGAGISTAEAKLLASCSTRLRGAGARSPRHGRAASRPRSGCGTARARGRSYAGRAPRGG